MTTETQSGGSPRALHQKWISDLPYQLLLLEKVHLGRDFPLDYSPESLGALESRLLEQPEHGDSAQGPERRAKFEESASAYLGEVLLGIAGGTWGWNTRPIDGRPGQPVVCPDPELELSPVAPRLLVSHALRERTGRAFAEEGERLRRAVAERRREFPGWKPVKKPTPHVDPKPPLPEDPALTAWLAEREEALGDWAEEAFRGGWRWNFHPDTLGWLETVLRQRFASVEEFDAARQEPFVQGACWYFGEVIRRVKGAVWQYIPFDPGAEAGAPGSRESVWTGVPFVDQPDKRVGGTAIPLGCLRELFLEQGSQPRLGDVLHWFRGSSYAHVGALLLRMGMVPQETVDRVLADYARFAHHELDPHEVPDTLKAFGVAVSAHGDDIDFLEDSYEYFLQEAAALTDGAVTIADVRLRADSEDGEGGEDGEDGEGIEVLEFTRNGVLVTQDTDHESEDYLDHLAIMEMIDHVDPDPGDDPRRFHLVQFVRLRDSTYDTYFVFATPEQATVLEKELGLDLR